MSTTIRVGDVVDIDGTPCRLIGYRATVRNLAPVVTDPPPGTRMYPVYAEQAGACRMFTRTPRIVVPARAEVLP